MGTVIMWFRRDLRLSDNAALWHAVRQGKEVLPVFILNPDQPHGFGNAQKWWLHHSLESLQKKLSNVGAPLVLRKGDHEKLIPDLAKEVRAQAVFWNDLFEPWAAKSDEVIKRELKSSNCEAKIFNSSLLIHPKDLKTRNGDYFKVFTPFYKGFCQKLRPLEVYDAPKSLSYKVKVVSENLDHWNLLSEVHVGTDYEIFTPGEEAAKQLLKHFVDEKLSSYKRDRDFPGKNGTSRLSPYLHFGEISSNQIWRAVTQATSSESSQKFLAEVAWREFSYYLLYHFPNLPSSNFLSEFDLFQWKDDPGSLEAWKNGMTGYPIVDAGMRELKETGYMHNRTRMIVASFLTKHLLIHWQKGAEWFWEKLFDADLASNSFSWQWVAGSGADGSPYFRIFNPVLQAEKFDPEGTYIRRWVPELRTLPNSYLSKPWNLSSTKSLKDGYNYPDPIVKQEFAKKRAEKFYASVMRK